MEYESKSPGGCRVVKRTQYSEDEIMGHFNEHLEIRRNGEIIKESVASQMNSSNQNSKYVDPLEQNSFSSGSCNQSQYSTDVMDPNSFFGSSYLNEIANKLK